MSSVKVRIPATIFCLALACFSVSQAPEKKTLPSLRTPRVQKIDVSHIQLDLKFDWQKRQAYGTATLKLSCLTASDQIALDAAKLSIEAISDGKGNPLKYSYAGGESDENLVIKLPAQAEPGQELTVVIRYRTNHINDSDPNAIGGSYGRGLRFFQPTKTTPNKRKQIWSCGEPQGSRYWFPCHDVPNDLRTTELIATVPSSMMALSNGKLISMSQVGKNRTFHYKMDTPYPNYLTNVVVGEYANISSKSGRVDLNTLAYPKEAQAAKDTVVRLPLMVKFFEETLGEPYPFDAYSQIMVQDYPFFSLTGHSSAPIISDNMIDDYRTHADFYYLWDGQEAQTLAAQWFGTLVPTATWEDSWLNGGFIRYMDTLFAEKYIGHDEVLLWNVQPDLNATLGDWSSGNRRPIYTRNYSDAELNNSDNYARFRSHLTLRALEKHFGRDVWFKAVRNYIQERKLKPTTTEDFKRSIEASTGQKLDWFFNQWVYKMGHPVFEITKNYDQAKGELTLKVTQTQTLDTNEAFPQTDFFQGFVDVEIDDKIQRVWVKPQKENSFSFTSEKEPRLVHFDFDSVWIKEFSFGKTATELMYQAKNDKDAIARNWAVDELVKIAKSKDVSPQLKAQIIANLREIASSNLYWRSKGYAVRALRGAEPTPSEPTLQMLVKLAKTAEPIVRSGAIVSLGNTKDPRFFDLYVNALNDESERVVNVAAQAIGKTKDPRAFGVLVKLLKRPSWKNQSLISVLDGLRELGDPRGFPIARDALANTKLERWWLATPVWDYPFAAVNTINALGKSAEVFPMMLKRFKDSLTENDVNDIFQNAQLLTNLADPRGQEVYELLKARFKDDANAMVAVNNLKQQFEDAVKEKK